MKIPARNLVYKINYFIFAKKKKKTETASPSSRNRTGEVPEQRTSYQPLPTFVPRNPHTRPVSASAKRNARKQKKTKSHGKLSETPTHHVLDPIRGRMRFLGRNQCNIHPAPAVVPVDCSRMGYGPNSSKRRLLVESQKHLTETASTQSEIWKTRNSPNKRVSLSSPR